MLVDHIRYSTVFDNAKTRRDPEAEDRIEPWDSESDDAVIDA